MTPARMPRTHRKKRRIALPRIDRSSAARMCTGRAPRCACLLLLAGLASAAPASAPGAVDEARLKAADAEPQNWLTGGRDKDGTYYSPLASINAGNVAHLGFAW